MLLESSLRLPYVLLESSRRDEYESVLSSRRDESYELELSLSLLSRSRLEP